MNLWIGVSLLLFLMCGCSTGSVGEGDDVLPTPSPITPNAVALGRLPEHIQGCNTTRYDFADFSWCLDHEDFSCSSGAIAVYTNASTGQGVSAQLWVTDTPDGMYDYFKTRRWQPESEHKDLDVIYFHTTAFYESQNQVAVVEFNDNVMELRYGGDDIEMAREIANIIIEKNWLE